MVSKCATGQSSFLSMDVEEGFNCKTGSSVTEAQAMLLETGQSIADITVHLRARSFGAWTVTQEVFDSPRIDDECGVFRRKRFGCDRDHDTWEATVETPRAVNPATGEHADSYDLSVLVGAYGTIRRTAPDGSYWEGKGKIVSAQVMPDTSSTDEELSVLMVQFEGGAIDDPAYTQPAAPV